MNSTLISKIDELRQYDTEREWFEFKENWNDPRELGEYISAISNSSAYEGIHDKTHEPVGTRFDPNQDVKGEPLKHFLARQIYPDVNFHFEEIYLEDKRVVVLVIPAAKTIPTSFSEERYIRIGSSKEKLRKYPEKESFLFSILRIQQVSIKNYLLKS